MCLKHLRFFLSHISKSLEAWLIQHLHGIIRSRTLPLFPGCKPQQIDFHPRPASSGLQDGCHSSRNHALSQLLLKARGKKEVILLNLFLFTMKENFPRYSSCLHGHSCSYVCHCWKGAGLEKQVTVICTSALAGGLRQTVRIGRLLCKETFGWANKIVSWTDLVSL